VRSSESKMLALPADRAPRRGSSASLEESAGNFEGDATGLCSSGKVVVERKTTPADGQVSAHFLRPVSCDSPDGQQVIETLKARGLTICRILSAVAGPMPGNLWALRSLRYCCARLEAVSLLVELPSDEAETAQKGNV